VNDLGDVNMGRLAVQSETRHFQELIRKALQLGFQVTNLRAEVLSGDLPMHSLHELEEAVDSLNLEALHFNSHEHTPHDELECDIVVQTLNLVRLFYRLFQDHEEEVMANGDFEAGFSEVRFARISAVVMMLAASAARYASLHEYDPLANRVQLGKPVAPVTAFPLWQETQPSYVN
jgi:hypothetical protein